MGRLSQSFIEDASVGYRLYTDKKCIGELRGTVVNVRWDKTKDAEPAILFDVAGGWEGYDGKVEDQRYEFMATFVLMGCYTTGMRCITAFTHGAQSPEDGLT
ncbi:hypothetical protein HPB52_004979 [Rhipicephalus sanguineus]|uniref:Uncharacterized protein n=1 Tax=Rhipicephalus sanguineus TaxID=34632 RepID=A0A9D4PWY5_RHISA|nr:hypothetical protein HPB52_004979 [Rhipicephalus sanguineus]